MFREIKIETHINKKPEDVWKAIADFPAYAQWNGFMTKISQPDDESLLVEFNSRQEVRMELLNMRENDELRWRGGIAGGWIFGGIHYLKVAKDGEGTLFTHGENFHGALTWVFWPLLKKKLSPFYEEMNLALKAYVEKQ